MFIELPAAWLYGVNIGGILCAHLGLSWLATRLPSSFFERHRRLFATAAWEATCYERCLRVRAWKHLLPDAAGWFGGFPKKKLLASDPAYLLAYSRETCRGEFSHWCQMTVIAGFIAWTPWPALLIILAYSLASNLPCIVNLRYTRLRLARLPERPCAQTLFRSPSH